MTKNTHMTHPEDSILTGDLSVLDAFLMWCFVTLKIDGAPAIVWGRNPESGNFFVGTKSVFNKRLIKINESHEDIDKNHSGNVATILHQCFKYLPHTNKIIQGDFIGFGDSFVDEFTPNTITYKFDDYVTENIIVAPHTVYASDTTLRDAIASPMCEQLEGNSFCRFVQPRAYIRAGFGAPIGESIDSFVNTKPLVDFARSLSTTVQFLSNKEAAVFKKEINTHIREQLDIVPETFMGGKYKKLCELYLLVMRIKLDALNECRHECDFAAYINNNCVQGEGYTMHSKLGDWKLINRRQFAYANFHSGIGTVINT